MCYRGTVKNGVVVLEPGAELPEGTSVRVEAEPKPTASTAALVKVAPEDDPLWSIPDLAVDTGISDLAVNLDHYLYGHPKVKDGC
ncbi:MAG: hypothetical protein AAB466_10190 [Verrucomicrobiota bacterium]